MTNQEWGVVIGVVTAAILALGPWLFMVHGRLVSIEKRLEDTEDDE